MHMIITINAENETDKIWYLFMMQTFRSQEQKEISPTTQSGFIPTLYLMIKEATLSPWDWKQGNSFYSVSTKKFAEDPRYFTKMRKRNKNMHTYCIKK